MEIWKEVKQLVENVMGTQIPFEFLSFLFRSMS